MRALRKDQRRPVNLTSDPIRGVIAVYLIICNRASLGSLNATNTLHSQKPSTGSTQVTPPRLTLPATHHKSIYAAQLLCYWCSQIKYQLYFHIPA